VSREPRRRVPPASSDEGLPLVGRLALIVAAAGAMAIAILAVDRGHRDRQAAAAASREWTPAGISEVPPVIASEAGPYLVLETAIDGDAAARRSNAHPRTLATYRALRAYPGAPPRVPHGVTAEEYRESRCNACHEAGGFSLRFGAYAPVTPHAGMGACVQCHLVDSELSGRALPGRGPDADCRQCHGSPGARASEPSTDWGAAAWPSLAARPGSGVPPIIPHDLDLRGNCAACHTGPAAVRELRTEHAGRVGCRQCHLMPETPEAESYARDLAVGVPAEQPR
jgi:nitrate reductase (cytochrome), electron transfer subunit